MRSWLARGADGRPAAELKGATGCHENGAATHARAASRTTRQWRTRPGAYKWVSPTSTDGLFRSVEGKPYLPVPGQAEGTWLQRRIPMKVLRTQAFRVLLVLSALASSALVIEAGQRWH